MPPRRPVYFRSADDPPVSPEHLERARAQGQVLSCIDQDNTVRWQVGERLNHLFEHSCERFGRNAAVDAGHAVLSYRELDERANRVARHLLDRGIRSGDRVGLLFDKTVETYVALLAVMKVNAAYVPLDPGFPTERIRFIVADADLTAIVSMSGFADRLGAFDVRQIYLDAAKRISTRNRRRASPTAKSLPPSIGSATSSIRRERPPTRKGSSSSIPASAILFGWPPSCTGSLPEIASTRACRSPSTSRSRRSGCR